MCLFDVQSPIYRPELYSVSVLLSCVMTGYGCTLCYRTVGACMCHSIKPTRIKSTCSNILSTLILDVGVGINAKSLYMSLR